MPDISVLTKNVGKFLSDNSPTILTAFGVAGTVSTTVLAVKATPQALRYIWEAESEFTEPLTNLEKIKLSWTCYIPALSVGVATIACIIGANSIHSRRQAALASVYTITEKAFREYQEKVAETIGENKERKVRDDLAQDRVNNNPPSGSQVIIATGGDTLCYDSLSGRYFKSDMETIRKAQNDLNDTLLSEMYVSQNDLNAKLGLPSLPYGDEIGWSYHNEGTLDISFSTVLSEDGKPCLVLNYNVVPVRGFQKFG